MILKRSVGSWIVIFAFLASGVLHLVNPQAFFWLLPQWTPLKIELVVLSGFFELASAIGLLFGAKWAPWLTVITLIGVWPANWWFAFESLANENLWLILAAWLRLPLQLPLIYFAWKSPVRSEGITS